VIAPVAESVARSPGGAPELAPENSHPEARHAFPEAPQDFDPIHDK
jgi:hypothetical protein